MDNYRELYLHLFNGITNTIRALELIQQEAEELFLAQEQQEPILQLYIFDQKDGDA